VQPSFSQTHAAHHQTDTDRHECAHQVGSRRRHVADVAWLLIQIDVPAIGARTQATMSSAITVFACL
jgi:hypothetical protein